MDADIWSCIYWVGILFPGFCFILVIRRMRWLCVAYKNYIGVPGKMCLWFGDLRVRNRDGLTSAEGLHKEEIRVLHPYLLCQSPGNGARK